MGIDSAFPFQIVSTLVFLLSATLLFIYLRRRVGDWPALLGSALILFLGAAWIDLLWAFQIGFSGSIAAGLGALLALDRDDRVGDRIACALLVVSISFSELGVPFVAGALVSVLVGGRPRIRRLYIAVVPLAFYAIWWLGWGHTAESAFSLDNVLESPKCVFDASSQAHGLAARARDATHRQRGRAGWPHLGSHPARDRDRPGGVAVLAPGSGSALRSGSHSPSAGRSGS